MIVGIIIAGIILDVFALVVIVDMLVHFNQRSRDRYILRVLKARREMQDEYMMFYESEPEPAKNHQGVVDPRILRKRHSRQHEAWIADLTKNERDLHDLYSDETVKIPLPVQEVIS